MFQKILIAVLALGLVGVSGAWAYSEWAGRAPAPVVAKPMPKPLKPVEAPAAEAKAEPAAEAREEVKGTPLMVEYISPRNPELLAAYNFVNDSNLFAKLPEVRGVDGTFVMPRPLKLVTAECQQVNAFYSPDKAEVVLCYEMIDAILSHASAIAEQKELGREFVSEYLMSNLRFIVLHELGHALIDQLDLNVTGREEDAADQLASTLILNSPDTTESPEDISRRLQMAATFFLAGSGGETGYDLGAYADEHSLGEQRYFNVLCILYGSDPGRYLGIVTRSGLPEARAMRCPQESRRVTRSWARLLTPHLARQFSPEEAQAVVERTARERADNASNPYVR